eukprot:TRINITY_DN6568_c0_g1_i1.p1 TRINITY_DN6568_c0_g1~~TRINITY_DN6568_c0_g1_i1.p1  ORF type:complete len:288 (+),score=43.22 TRINITY_DN6568_c0_g1_i1:57-920(+)
MEDKDCRGNKMKQYELSLETRLNPKLPFIVRLDGHRFSKFTQGFAKPFDPRICQAMILTTADLVSEFNASTGYTQSDEITLVFPVVLNEDTEKLDRPPSIIFNGRIQKLVSLVSAYCSVRFAFHLSTHKYDEIKEKKLLDKIHKAFFDARVFQLQGTLDISENLIWRMSDCKRNSKNNLGHCHFAQKELHGLSPKQVLEKLATKGISWEKMPPEYKWGVFVKRKHYEKEGKNPKTGESLIATRTRIYKASFNMVKPTEELEQLWLAKVTNTCGSFNDQFLLPVYENE